MRPDGQRRAYALRPEPFRELEGWLTRYRQVWDERLDRFGAALAITPGPAGRGTHGRKRT